MENRNLKQILALFLFSAGTSILIYVLYGVASSSINDTQTAQFLDTFRLFAAAAVFPFFAFFALKPIRQLSESRAVRVV